MGGHLYTLDEAVKAFGLGKDALRRRIREGRLQAVKENGPYGYCYYIRQPGSTTAGEATVPISPFFPPETAGADPSTRQDLLFHQGAPPQAPGVGPALQRTGERKNKLSAASIVRSGGNIVSYCFVAVILLLLYFLVQSNFSGDNPRVFGYQVYVVSSGSMSPAFDTGSLIFVREAAAGQIETGDVITFSSAGSNELITHRVVQLNEDAGLSFTTRGDANNADDSNPVYPEQLSGRMHFSLPYLGYLLNFGQTRQGLVMLVLLPGLLIIVYELYNIYRYLVRLDRHSGKKVSSR